MRIDFVTLNAPAASASSRCRFLTADCDCDCDCDCDLGSAAAPLACAHIVNINTDRKYAQSTQTDKSYHTWRTIESKSRSKDFPATWELEVSTALVSPDIKAHLAARKEFVFRQSWTKTGSSSRSALYLYVRGAGAYHGDAGALVLFAVWLWRGVN